MKKKIILFSCWVGGTPNVESNSWFFFLGFSWNLVRDPCRANLNSELQPVLEKPKHAQSEVQPTSGKPPNEKSKISIKEVDHRLWKAWPSPVRSSQILAIKKAKLLKLLPLSISYGGPYKKNNKGAPPPTRNCFKNSDSNFFAYLFLLSHRFCSGR